MRYKTEDIIAGILKRTGVLAAVFVFALTSGLGAAAIANAQTTAPTEAAAKPTTAKPLAAKEASVHFVNMDEEFIEGRLRKPSGTYIPWREPARFGPWLRLKRSFLPELKASGTDPSLN